MARVLNSQGRSDASLDLTSCINGALCEAGVEHHWSAMSSHVLDLTRYYSEVQRRSNLDDKDFDSTDSHITVDFVEFQEGKLNTQSTAELYALAQDAKSSKYKQKSKKSDSANRVESPDPKAKPIQIVISCVTLRQNSHTTGLLLVPASLSPDGSLSGDLQSAEPWIPVSRMRTRGISDREVMVGDLSAFWKWRIGRGQQLASAVEEWPDIVDLSLDLFRAVADDDFSSSNTNGSTEIITDTCFISPGEVITANGAVLELYRFLADGAYSNAPVYQRLLSGASETRIQSDYLDCELDNLKKASVRSTGSMSDEFPLTESQRRAVHAFHFDGSDSITAVSGPPGTGKTTMLQSVVASLIVSHALEAKPAPLIVGTSTNNQAVTNIIDSFSKVAKEIPGVLDKRWLPVASEEGASQESLNGIATYCPSQSKVQDAKKAEYLLEDKRKGGVYSQYSEPEYVSTATAFFLQQCAEYSSQARMSPPKDLKTALKTLRKALCESDKARRNLIEQRSFADHQAHTGLRTTTAKASDLRQKLDERQRQLGAWTQHLHHMQHVGNMSSIEQEFVIRMNYEEDEPAPRFDTLTDFVRFYQSEVTSLTNEINSLDHEIDQAKYAARLAHDEYRQNVTASLFGVKTLGLLSSGQVKALENATDLYELDQQLDITVRYAQFWLAIHIYEAEWLLTASGDDLIPNDERKRTTAPYMDKYWKQVTALTPCFVMTVYQLPKYFKLWTQEGEKPEFDLGRPDLLIVDEAGQVDTSVGAAAFALPKRALVVGDVLQLAPVWSIDPDSDREMAAVFGLGDHWDHMVAHGITSSEHSSVMAASSTASRWCYGSDLDPGLFLAEHFRCHTNIIEYCNDLLYKGMLKPKRPLGSYKLKNKTEKPFLFKEVPNSEDQRKGSSRINRKEAEAIATWIRDNFDFFRRIYNPAEEEHKNKTIVGVVTPFAAQARLIEQQIGRTLEHSFQSDITVGTAHRLQGAERSVVLFSPVYGDNTGQASFIDGTLELMNVAVSRAKDLFIVFGGARRWDDTGPVFKLVRKHAVQSGCNFAKRDTTANCGIKDKYEHETPHDSTSADAGLESETSELTVAEVPFVDRHAPGYRIAAELLKEWRENEVLPPSQKVNAAQLNEALSRFGLITRNNSSWAPTVRGVDCGIALYEGQGKNGRYTNLIYSPQAQEKLTELARDGKLAPS